MSDQKKILHDDSNGLDIIRKKHKNLYTILIRNHILLYYL